MKLTLWAELEGGTNFEVMSGEAETLGDLQRIGKRLMTSIAQLRKRMPGLATQKVQGLTFKFKKEGGQATIRVAETVEQSRSTAPSVGRPGAQEDK